ncbi:MAG: CDP-alcohol phosphatidyltransferase family protein [Terriglobia bacterium]
MITRQIGRASRWLLLKIADALAATGIHPNLLTLLGFVVNIWAAMLFAAASATDPAAQKRQFLAAGIIIFFAGIFDFADGLVARRQGRVTPFGAFFDSIIDRYSDLVLYMGLLVYYARGNRFFYVVLVAVAMAGSFMVSYARARAESLIPECRVGFMERPERVVLLIIGSLFNRMAPVLWVIAVLTTLTVIHRIAHTWQQTRAGRVVSNPGPPP